MGGKKISSAIKRELTRASPKKTKVRDHSNTILATYDGLIDSFTKVDFMEYEKFMRYLGTPGRKRTEMFRVITDKGITGPVLQLAEIRSKNLSDHQKILQVLRYRWVALYEHRKELLNTDPNRFWEHMAMKLTGKGNRSRGIHISSTWEGVNGRETLENFLKTMYKKQGGKCAITGEPLELTLGTDTPNPNKCSIDRINSNNGYTPQNVWLVAWWVNQMKMSLDLKDFWEKIHILNEARLRLDK